MHTKTQDTEVRVTATYIAGIRLYRTEDGRLLSQQQLDAYPDRYSAPHEIEAAQQLALSA